MTTETLKELRQVFLEVAGPQFAYNKAGYEAGKSISRLTGHCYICARYVQGRLGGELIVAKIDADYHYWNRLSDGSEVDLTSCQYGGDGFKPVTTGRICRKKFRPLKRYDRFKVHVDEALNGHYLLNEAIDEAAASLRAYANLEAEFGPRTGDPPTQVSYKRNPAIKKHLQRLDSLQLQSNTARFNRELRLPK